MLAAVRAHVQAASPAARERPEVVSEALDRVAEDVATAYRHLRELETALVDERPLVELGVAEAFRALADEVHARAGGPDVDVTLTPPDPPHLDLRPSVREALYFVV
ncbi:MAG: hypothetical protein QOH46_845, partial [Solirubrobacteraceae bacterium]|nr:hypothetical protein [Solirubrobacteraceae bacterium]